MWVHKKSSSQRGYGYAHRKRRAALLRLAIGTPCPLCDEVMLATQGLDLDHSIPLALGGKFGDRITHRSCNRKAGAKLGSAMVQRNRANKSRDW